MVSPSAAYPLARTGKHAGLRDCRAHPQGFRHRVFPGLGKSRISPGARETLFARTGPGLRHGPAWAFRVGTEFEREVPGNPRRSSPFLSRTVRGQTQRLCRLAQPLHGGPSPEARLGVSRRGRGAGPAHAGARRDTYEGDRLPHSDGSLLWENRRTQGYSHFCEGARTPRQGLAGQALGRSVGLFDGSESPGLRAEGSEGRGLLRVTSRYPRQRAGDEVSAGQRGAHALRGSVAGRQPSLCTGRSVADSRAEPHCLPRRRRSRGVAACQRTAFRTLPAGIGGEDRGAAEAAACPGGADSLRLRRCQ